MEKKRYCSDCDYYVPGGIDPNCLVPGKKAWSTRCTCPIKEACDSFIPKDNLKHKTQ